MNQESQSVVMLGATGAVGDAALRELLNMPEVKHLMLLGRRPVADLVAQNIEQHSINIFDPTSYSHLLSGYTTAICTLGVGQPSKMSRAEFIKIDKDAVVDFATNCKAAGVQHFELLSSVGASSSSRSFFLRTKGELNDALAAMNFKRLSIFQPSMILTPTNRYGFAQAVTLKVWPLLKSLLVGGLRKYRGVGVEDLGAAMAQNISEKKMGLELLQWDDFQGFDTSK